MAHMQPCKQGLELPIRWFACLGHPAAPLAVLWLHAARRQWSTLDYFVPSPCKAGGMVIGDMPEHDGALMLAWIYLYSQGFGVCLVTHFLLRN